MKGSQKVIDYLNFLLGGELAARDQYFIHSEMYGEWHYGKLYERSNGWIDGNTRTKLVIAPTALAELNRVNAFGASVKKMLSDTYPNMEILSAPEMVTGAPKYSAAVLP